MTTNICPTLPNEQERVKALHRLEILDTPPEDTFDSLTQLAANICGVPICLISLVDSERQWFKSRIGLQIQETPRNVSFCQYAILGSELMEIPDALEDARFRSNPLVTGEPHIRFYAGMPIRDPEGNNLGTLCLLDRVPRKLTLEQSKMIALLAQQAVRQFELRRTRIYLEREAALNRAVVRDAATAIIIVNAEGMVTRFNPAAERLLGWPAVEVVSRIPLTFFLDPQQLNSLNALPTPTQDDFQRVIAATQSNREGAWEWNLVRRDGTRIPARLEVGMLHTPTEQIAGYIVVASDLTAERRLQDQSRRLQQALLAMRDHETTDPAEFVRLCTQTIGHALEVERASIWSFDPTRDAIKCSDLFQRRAATHESGLTLRAIDFPDYFAAIEQEDSIIAVDAYTHPATRCLNACYLEPLGIRSMLDVPIRTGGRLAGVVCCEHVGEPRVWTAEENRFAIAAASYIMLALEKADRLGAESQLARRESLLQILGDNLHQGSIYQDLTLADGQQRFVYLSNGTVALFGVPIAEALTNPNALRDRVHPDDRAALAEEEQRALRTLQPLDFQARVLPRGGTQRWVQFRSRPTRTPDGDTLWHGLALDITAQKEAEQQLREAKESLETKVAARTEALVRSEAKFRALTEASLVGVFVLQDRRFRYANATQAAILGQSVESLLELPDVLELVIEQERPNFDRLLQSTNSSGANHREFTVLRPNGTRRILEILLTPITFADRPALLGSALDVTDRRRLEQQSLRKQRLESLGTLAGGVAHDLNNALSPVLMLVQSMRMLYPDELEMLNLVESSVQRAKKMVKQLLTYARGVEGVREPVKLADLIRELERIIESTFPKSIRLTTSRAQDSQQIIGDSTQLLQVLLNLCVNARDAMPEGGLLTLITEYIHIVDHPEAPQGDYACIQVADSGTGMSQEIIDRIFDPFYTTKSSDLGTGLGLSTALGIVRSHRGFISVSSTPGHGSTFTILLPVDNRQTVHQESCEAIDVPQGNGGLVMIVDDEPYIRTAGSLLLQRLNYRPISAQDAEEALLLAQQRGTELLAVITDLHMPKMDGLTFAIRLREILPNVPILMTSGHMSEAEASRLASFGRTSRLDKPFSEPELSAALKSVLSV